MTGVLASMVGILIILFLIYAFQGLLAFIPYLIGLFFKFLFFPIEFFNQVFYPVGGLVYVVYTGLIFALIMKLILNFFKHKI